MKIKLVATIIIFSTVLASILYLVSINKQSPKKAINSNEESLLDKAINSTRKINVREAAVAGTFYPEDKEELQTQLNSLLSKANIIQNDKKLRILVVPHAGIQYSGEIAARGFKQIEGQEYKKVILIGPSHRVPTSKAAVYREGQWETPLGTTNVDSDLAGKILSPNLDIISDKIPHAQEHALELELIFLQHILGSENFEIVPILLGQPTDTLINNLAAKIAYLMNDETLVVISTDLSHYPNYDDANEEDKITVEAIMSGDKEVLDERFSRAFDKPELSTYACGYQPLRVALKISELLNINDYINYGYMNSGDVVEETKERAVGYVSIGMYKDILEPIVLSDETKIEALKIARETLNKYYSRDNLNNMRFESNDLGLPLGAFVTLNKNDVLRGCIGAFEPDDTLFNVIKSVSISSATKDPRFTPVTADELKDIDIEISIMTPQKRINSWEDIVLGKHGVAIEHENKKGVLLPQVATDNNWDLITFLEQLCLQKTGANKECFKDPNAKIYVFEVDKFDERDFGLNK